MPGERCAMRGDSGERSAGIDRPGYEPGYSAERIRLAE
jgi:hypothetical protein